ncbi:MAG: methyltransferase domain-containing protein [Phycisphaerales bacterium]|nr:MAG: methyltransferase domain-containing protein [Phycisphaerales bacterium]
MIAVPEPQDGGRSLGKSSGLIRAAIVKTRQDGVFAFAIFAARKILDRLRRSRCGCAEMCRSHVIGGHGLEIGGPSRIFSRSGEIPLYDFAAKIDGLNFSTETVWASELGEDSPFSYRGKVLGRQYVREASRFPDIDSAAFDFVLSSHVVEHLANPLRGLREWGRVLRDEGVLILAVPHKDATFDHLRPLTKIEHILEDFRNDVGEDDPTHIPEVLALHDFARDFWATDREEFARRCADNVRNRCVHHHVFDTDLAVRLVDQAGFRILAVDHALPNSIVIVAKKGGDGPLPENADVSGDEAEWRRTSPFPTDKGRMTRAAISRLTPRAAVSLPDDAEPLKIERNKACLTKTLNPAAVGLNALTTLMKIAR